MSSASSEPKKLSLADSDALLKYCRLSLRIPDNLIKDAPLSIEDILGKTPLRQFLYQGENVQAYVVAMIPNTDQIRWALAAEMRRKDSLALSKGELAVDADEVEQFFAGLCLCITAHQAKTTVTAVDSSHTPRRLPGRSVPTRRISNVSCGASFTANIVPNQEDWQGSLLVKKVDNGSWCCAYRFTIKTPLVKGYQVSAFENSMLFEIRAACIESSASLRDGKCNGDSREVEYRGGQGDGSLHLEELSIRISSWMSKHDNSVDDTSEAEFQSRHDIQPDLGLNAMSKPLKYYKTIQALVPTRQILSISARVMPLPPSFGTDAALVEMRVQNDSAVATTLSLETVTFQTSHWHVQHIGTEFDSLPFTLSKHSCFQMVFRTSPLADPVKMEALNGLNVLNVGGITVDTGTKGALAAPDALYNEPVSPTTGKHIERSLDVSFSATAMGDNGALDDESFEVIHRIYPIHKPQQLQQQHEYTHTSGTNVASSAGRTSNVSETLHSTSPKSIYSQSKHIAADGHGDSNAENGAGVRVAGNYSHLKTASLDHKASPSQRPPGRKYSLAFPPKTLPTQPDSINTQISHEKQQQKQQIASMSRTAPHLDRQTPISTTDHPLTPPVNSKYGTDSLDRRGSLSDQRLRATKSNPFGVLPPLPSQKTAAPKAAVSGSGSTTMASNRPRSSISTIRSAASSISAGNVSYYPQQKSPLSSSFNFERISLRRRPSAGSVLATESLYNVSRPHATIGTIELSFEAPPRVVLGQELAVKAYISNNTNTHYFRLCLVDGDGTGATAGMALENGNSVDTQGLAPINHVTAVPPLRPGESAFVTLQYIAAAPYFHAVSLLRLVNLDADSADKTVISIDSPFVIFVDDGSK